MEKARAEFHREIDGSIYCWLEIKGRSFGATYPPGYFNGISTEDVLAQVQADILDLIKEEYTKNPSSFR